LNFEALDIEDMLPEDLSSLRKRNDLKFHSSDPIEEKLPKKEELIELINDGYGGIVRSILQVWMRTNEIDIDYFEILVRTDDRSIPRHRYVEWCNELLKIDHQNEVALQFLLYYLERNEGGEDEDWIVKRLASLHPNNPQGKKEKIQKLIENEDFELALQMCQEILEVDDGNKFALRNRGIICTLMKRNDDAAYYWSEWLDSGEAPVRDWFRAARAHYNCKHYSESIAIIEHIIVDYPEKEKILDLYIRANYSLFEWSKCFDLCEELLDINSRNSTGLKYMRLTKARLGPKMAVLPTFSLNSNEKEIDQGVIFWYEYI
jgi:tetratricopeptide (TPR) repeat protein